MSHSPFHMHPCVLVCEDCLSTMLILRLVACVTCVSGRCSAKEYIVCEMVIWVGVVIEVERGGEGKA